MKIQENKIQEHTGTSFSITKEEDVSVLQFNEQSIISNTEEYATIILGDCTNCKKIKDRDTGTKPTPFDSPLLLQSIPNNVGYKIGEQTTINKSVLEQLNFPF